ncbi:MAG: hypothetical protein J7507_15440, partial [Pseudoxanthomonas sp.]|nr:hypothetical protein [Pseudoxanthomonas sp.]
MELECPFTAFDATGAPKHLGRPAIAIADALKGEKCQRCRRVLRKINDYRLPSERVTVAGEELRQLLAGSLIEQPPFGIERLPGSRYQQAPAR